MYKIMLADDEGIVIDALKFIIYKNFEESCNIEYAKTGRSVIELAESFSPDIAFMDIQMPGINGIEAMKEIRKHNPGIIFIVISAYDKFDYARESIELGVWSYINKPIEQTIIVDTLRKAMKKIDNERNKRSNDLIIREKLNTVVPIIESGFIFSVLFQENFALDTENYKNLLGIGTNLGYILVIKYGEAQEEGRLTNPVGISVRTQSYHVELREIIKDYFNCFVGAMMTNMVVAYVPYDPDMIQDEYEARIAIIEKARQLARKLESRIDAKFRIGIGTVKKIKEATDSYTEAMNALQLTRGAVAHAKDLPIGCSYEKDYPIDTEKALFEAIQKGDTNTAVVQAGNFFDWMEGNYPVQIMNVKLKVLEFVLYAERIGYLSGGMIYHFESRSNYLQTIQEMDNYDLIRKWFLDKIRETCRNVSTKKAESTGRLIEKAKVYIDNHYRKDISLDDVSKEVNISPYYFSKLFKEETGINFIEYVTHVRMEKAKQLLKQQGMSMKEICIEVGYSDPNYFSRSFKKNTGLTPTEYKWGK